VRTADTRARTTGPLRVLVVDDNVDTSEMLAELIASDGHAVRTSTDGVTALQVASELHPHVVLLDIGLPRMDGYEVARRIKRMPELAGVMLVALTGYGQASDRERALQAGFEHHVVKPVEWDELRALLQKASAASSRPNR
jgi:CheY-like chemotaxis protein